MMQKAAFRDRGDASTTANPKEDTADFILLRKLGRLRPSGDAVIRSVLTLKITAKGSRNEDPSCVMERTPAIAQSALRQGSSIELTEGTR
jgi:hypothetical protein